MQGEDDSSAPYAYLGCRYRKALLRDFEDRWQHITQCLQMTLFSYLCCIYSISLYFMSKLVCHVAHGAHYAPSLLMYRLVHVCTLLPKSLDMSFLPIFQYSNKKHISIACDKHTSYHLHINLFSHVQSEKRLRHISRVT